MFKIWCALASILLYPFTVSADIFVPGSSGTNALREALAEDRSGYYFHSSALDARPTAKQAADNSSFSSGTLGRDTKLYDIDASFIKEFDETFTRPGLFDKYKLSRNNLLLLEYSSPALADVIKHFLVMAMERLILEQQRLIQIEQGSQGPLDRLRLLSERDCLREHQGEGLVKAMEACKRSAQPFDAIALINGQGSLADGRRNIHVVRDSLSLLGLNERSAPDKAAVLCGDIVIKDDNYTEILPKESLEGRVEVYRQKYTRQWQEVLSQKDISGAALSDLSLPGVSVTSHLLNSIKVLDLQARTAAIIKLAALLARARAYRDYNETLVYLDQARRLPQLEQEFKMILHDRQAYVMEVIASAGNTMQDPESYRALIADLFNDADTARQRLITDAANAPLHDYSSDTLLFSR